MYKLYTKNGNVEAVGKEVNDNSDNALVFVGKFGKKVKFKRRSTNQSEDAYIKILESNDYIYVGVATFSKSGRLITCDTFDTLYWELNTTTDIAIARFKNFLKSFADIYLLTTKQSLSVIEQDTSVLIDFGCITMGIGISQELNILNCAGKGCGQISLSQSEAAFWLLLYLHTNGCIKLSTTEDEIQSKSRYPALVKDFIHSNKSLFDALGLGCGLSRIKPLF
jgi:hypothetical protein|tara:strand:- start:6505 stop:7173 length:669 start_codon:yes stop_codon:yes gene_type:complete